MTRQHEGEAFSPGIGMGRASVLPELITPASTARVDSEQVDRELDKFREALDRAREATHRIRDRTGDQLYEQLADLFSVQEKMLGDPLFVEGVEEQIKEGRHRAESAVMKTLETIENSFGDRFSGDALQGRVIDLVDVGWRVLKHMDTSAITQGLPHGGILIARDLSPGMAVRLEDSDIDGLVTSNTDQSSHTAVVAQALEIPAVGIRDESFFEEIDPGEEVIVAANRDRVIVEPDDDVREKFTKARDRFYQFTHRIRRRAGEIDDEQLPCAIRGNIGLFSELPFLEKQGGHGAGLVRTELLFMADREEYPSYEDQLQSYRRLASAVSPFAATIRTFDVGGDKEAFQSAPEEPGKQGRGIHRSLRERGPFHDQLKALVETYRDHENLKILIPMVGGPGEVRAVREILQSIGEELDAELPPLGVMVEIPSSVFLLSEITEVVDFLSIGTNDLMYYLTGADRFEAHEVDSVEIPDPALFRCIRQIVNSSGDCPVSVCGELAGNPVFTPVLVGLGVNELSMSPIRIPEVKLIAREIDTEQARELAEALPEIDERDEIRQWVGEELGPLVQELLYEDQPVPEDREYNY